MNKYKALRIIKESGLKLIRERNGIDSKKNKRSNKKEEDLIKSIGLSEFKLEKSYFDRLKEIFNNEAVSYDIDRDNFSIHVGEDLTVLFHTRDVRVVSITNWGNGSGNFKTGDWVYLGDSRDPHVPVSEVTFDEIVSAIKSAKESNSLNSEEEDEETNEEEAFEDKVWEIVASELTDSQFEDMQDYRGDLEDLLLKHYDNGADELEVAAAIIDKWCDLTDYDFEDEDEDED